MESPPQGRPRRRVGDACDTGSVRHDPPTTPPGKGPGRRLLLPATAAVLVLAACSPVASPPTPSPDASPGTPAASASPGTPAASPPATTSPATSPAAGACAAAAKALTLRQQAGQLVMMGVTGSLDAAERRALEASEFGSVILMGTSTDGVAGTRARTDALQQAGASGVLVAVDQEGGLVQRLKGSGFDTMPSAVDQARLSDAELRTAAARWGRQLAAAGVHLDLAPVADVVPAARVRTNEPIGRLDRGYGSDPAVVGAKVAAFVTGMRQAGVATSAKHFPNLGQVVGNTDFASGVVDDVTTADDAALEPYRAAVGAGVQTIMVGTARYTRIDPAALAAFSPKVVSLVRALGFDGVIVSDDLGVAKAVADVPAAQRAVRFVRAGGDLAIAVDVPSATAMAEGLASAAAADPALAELVGASTRRVLALKDALGVETCAAP